MRCLTLIQVLLMAPLAVSAEEVWQTVGDWSIMVSTNNSSRCFASRTLDDGSEVQMGTEPTLDGGYFAIYNAEWTHIEDGQSGTVEFDFGTSRFGGEMMGKVQNGMPGGYAFFNNPAFVQAIARSQTAKITGSQGNVFELDLTGTAKAIRGVLLETAN